MKKTLFALVGAAVGVAGLAGLDAAHARGDVVAMKEAATPDYRDIARAAAEVAAY